MATNVPRSLAACAGVANHEIDTALGWLRERPTCELVQLALTAHWSAATPGQLLAFQLIRESLAAREWCV